MTPNSRLHVLVVEDNPVNREIAVCFLEDLGHDARTATNGAEALPLLASMPFDIVLMDLEMPVMDGFETASRIRKGDAGEDRRQVPIVAVTAHSLPECRRRCLECGMDAFTAKPVRLEELLRIIERLCAPGASRVLDVATAMENLRGKQDLYERICSTYLADIPERRAVLLRCRECGDMEGAAQQAHALKSSSGLIGARQTEDAACRLESCVRNEQAEEAPRCLEDLLCALEALEKALRAAVRSGPARGCAPAGK